MTAPRPLRDDHFLLGKPQLTEAESQRVESANRLYELAVRILRWAFLRNVFISVENPERSWLWAILALFVRRTCDESFQAWYQTCRKITFSACMWGSRRDKRTSWLCPAYVLDSLERDCDQSHEHAPWGASQTHGRLQFHTALEAEYPQPLCAHVADCVRKRDQELGFDVQAQPHWHALSMAQTGSQSRKYPRLMPEFKYITRRRPDRPFKLLSSPDERGVRRGALSQQSSMVYFLRLKSSLRKQRI